jgi:hypothetical protein
MNLKAKPGGPLPLVIGERLIKAIEFFGSSVESRTHDVNAPGREREFSQQCAKRPITSDRAHDVSA